MAKQTTRNIKLSEDLLPLVGNAPDDIAMTLMVAAEVLEPLLAKIETVFTVEQWRALAYAVDVAAYRPHRDPERRLDLDIDEACGIDQPDLAMNINAINASLTPAERWAVLAVIDFAKRHFPTQLDSAEWWTVATRHRIFSTQQLTTHNGKVRRTKRKMTGDDSTVTKAYASS